ncbi:hypothetical protein [Mycolicibacter engbaekii]|uniref:hypothetical protein n=1 Tax=Mycolicibacter engbaekii TaxID=188915 RepID=UPI0010547ACD|nr:hypothetical protein [Mycolicibacter engbaekii]
MAPHYPPHSPYPYGPPHPYGSFPPPRRRPWDVIAAILLAVLLMLACGFGVILSMYAGMITDKCSGARHCSDSLIYAAYLVTWGGIGAALLVTLIGMVRSGLSRRTMIGWPARGWAIFVLTFAAGGLLLNAGVGG